MKKETLEEIARTKFPYKLFVKVDVTNKQREAFIKGYKLAQERSYSEEELLNLLTHFAVEIQRQNKKGQYPIEIKSWFERNKEKFKKK